MTHAIDTFFSAWAESDAAVRKNLIASAFSDAAIYADPRSSGELSGIDAISDYVGMFSANAPGWEARVVKTDETAGVTRVTVAFGGKGPDGSDMVQHGQYFAELADDKVTKLIGFVGLGDPD